MHASLYVAYIISVNQNKHYFEIFTVILDPTVDGKQEEQPELPLSKTGNSDFFYLNFLLTFLLVFLFVV